MAVVYRDPTGRETQEPNVDFIADRIRSAGVAYWQAQSATADLTFQGPGENTSAQLVIMVEEPYGVLLRYCTPSGEDEFVLTNGEADTDEEVPLYPGGEEWLVPLNHFVNVEIATVVVAQFIKDGSKRPGPWHLVGT